MVKKRETKVAELRDQTAVSRRDFVKAGAAAGVGAAILSAPGKAQAQPAPADIRWDYEGGCDRVRLRWDRNRGGEARP